MKKKDILEQYTDLLQERDDVQKRINNTIATLERMAREGNVKDHVKGGEGNMQTFVVEGFPVADFEDKEFLLRKLQRILNERNLKISEKLLEVEEYITRIDDARIRRIIDYRYVKQLSWVQTAHKMGGKATEDSIRKELERYLKKN